MVSSWGIYSDNLSDPIKIPGSSINFHVPPHPFVIKKFQLAFHHMRWEANINNNIFA